MTDKFIQPDYTVAQAAAIFGVTTQAIYKMMNRGELDSYKAGRARRIKRESIEKIRSGG